MYDIELLTVIKFLCSDMKLTTSQTAILFPLYTVMVTA